MTKKVMDLLFSVINEDSLFQLPLYYFLLDLPQPSVPLLEIHYAKWR
jgi:hypothetical protein